jgi:hypothetical protein
MTDFASLKIQVDSTDAKSAVTALDGLTAAGKKTATSANQLEAALKGEALAAERAAKGLVTASSAAGQLRMQQSLAGAAATKMASEAQAAAARATGLGATSKLAGYQVQNLAYQLNDVAVSLASGQKPMTVFMQQGSQIAQIMMQAGLGTGGFVKAIGSMVGGFLLANPLILAAAGVAGVLATGIGLVTDEINKTSAVTVTWQDTMLGAFDVVSGAVSGAVVSAFQAMGLDIGAVWESVKAYTKGAINFMIGASLAVPKVIAAAYQGIPAAFGDAFYSAANLAIEALNKLAQMSAAPLNLIIDGLNAAFGTKLPKMIIGGIGAIANPYAGAMRSLGSAGAKAFVGAFTTDYVGGIADSISGAAQSRARARLAAAADKGGKDVGGAAGKAAGAAASKAMADEWAKRMADDLKSTMDILERSAGEAASRINSEITAASEADWSAFVSAFKLGEDLTAKMRQDMDDIVEKAAKVQFEKLDATIDALDRLGGIGGSLGNIGAIARGLGSGDFSGVTGNIGGILNLVNQTDSGKKFLQGFGDKLDNIFGGAGQFTRTITGALNTLGVGVGIAGIVGNGSKGSQIGGAAGAAIGSIIPGIGTIVGSIVGSIFGGLFKKAKTGSASVTDGGISIGGNNNDAKGNSSGIGGSVQGSLAKIIEALGGTAGSYGFSIGQREDEFRVSGSAGADVTGKNPSGLLYRGKSAEEAARVALLNAINDGAVAGIREGASNLLKSGKDLESALAKALKFNAVFDDLARESDPAKYAMDAMNKELADLKAIFDEAGASASDYAALEELAAIRRTKAYNEAIAPQRELEIQIMRLEGKELDATNAERAMELAGLNATLRLLKERVYALTDEAIAAQAAAQAQAEATAALEAATAKAKALNSERLGMEATLLELTGDKAGALAIKRSLELQAMDESLRALQMQIYAEQDRAAAVITARDALNAAYQSERAELTATADKFTSLANSLRAFRATLYSGESGSYGSSLAALRSTGNMAALGSESAIGNLPGVAGSFLASSKANSASLVDYKRDVARVANIVDKAIGGADGTASAAQQQLAALDKSVEGLLEVKESVVTVEQAIADLREAMALPTRTIADTAVKAREEDKQAAMDLLKEVAAMRDESRALNLKTVENTATMARFLARVDGAGVRVFNDNASPIYTTAAT